MQYIYTVSAIKSIDRYRQIEKKSGIDFYNEVGFLTIRGPDEEKIDHKAGMSGPEKFFLDPRPYARQKKETRPSPSFDTTLAK